jgi:3-dehydroquinate synthase
MDSLSIDLGDRSYPIYIGSGLLSVPGLLLEHLPGGPLLLISNTTVAPLYAERVRQALGERRVAMLTLPDGEQHKTFATLSRIFDALVAERIPRDGAILALGGGVVGDMAGFAAACWQRGIAYAQLPTTLLAQVDSSVGGKTAVNHPGGKNLIGAFHQPAVVIADTDTLQTLPPRELRAGLAGVVKYGLIADVAFFEWLELNLDALLACEPGVLARAIRRSCELKARLVSLDEREQGPRALLNLGHTFGHAIETAAGYGEWLHGEAIAAGTMLAAEMSQRLGWLDTAAVARIRQWFERAGLPTTPPRLGIERTLELMRMDKKVLRGQLRLVLLRRIGEAVVTGDYAEAALLDTLRAQVA